jgi:hypothetical protein
MFSEKNNKTVIFDSSQSQRTIFTIYHELQIYLFCVLNKIEKLGQFEIE